MRYLSQQKKNDLFGFTVNITHLHNGPFVSNYVNILYNTTEISTEKRKIFDMLLPK